MLREKIYIQRIKKFHEKLKQQRFSKIAPLQAEYIYKQENPIPFSDIEKFDFKPIKEGEKWGELWGSAWFRFKGKIPESAKGKKVAALININAEGCVWQNGSPVLGLTSKIHWYLGSAKEFVLISENAKGDESVDILLEAGANGLFGSGENDYRIKFMQLATVDEKKVKLSYDLDVLISLFENLEKDTARRNKLIYGLNQICNVWNAGKGIDQCLQISKNLLSKKANESAMTAFSIGHAHLDLAWLWPIRETRRKGGRTFSTALQLIEEYPEYKFGASQYQLYEWIKEDYPQLYERVKKAIKDKRWEVQGAMWVEPDMNLSGGESLVRQCLFGKRFAREEFGLEIKDLWLPDVFGYSAALPQILKKCEVDYFMTQKISWNETNTFPHHTFYWEGIDGTEILTHFLPTNNYNLSNTPKELIESEKRYAQNDVSDEFLNLFGVGDGGGGPSRHHIEMGLRQQNLEGVPKFKFSFANDFYKKIAQIPKETLPSWKGELYLELHRGTYTTQALMKKHNRMLEQKLHDVEFIGSLDNDFSQTELDRIWKDTLLNQFHDILPGSSINWVYKDANRISKENLEKLAQFQIELLENLHLPSSDKKCLIAYNTQSWQRKEVISLDYESGNYLIKSADKEEIVTAIDGKIDFKISVPSYGYSIIQIEKTDEQVEHKELLVNEFQMENNLISIKFAKSGVIISIFDKVENREVLQGKANEFLLWEDLPNNWGAWDINHYYLETEPEKSKREEVRIDRISNDSAILYQKLSIGKSTIEQKITMHKDSRLIAFENTVDWKEEHKMLRVDAKPAIHSEKATYEIQYGQLDRPTHANTSWDAAKFEVAAHRYADLSQPDYGFAVINNCKYGHRIAGNNVSLNLLRSPKDTDKEADLHTHEFKYAYYPHKYDLESSDTIQIAHEFNSPLITRFIANQEIKEKSFYRIIGKNVKLEVVKKAEDGKGKILRFYETCGSSQEITLECNNHLKKVQEVNMLERKISDLNFEQNKVIMEFNPFEIKTIKITEEEK